MRAFCLTRPFPCQRTQTRQKKTDRKILALGEVPGFDAPALPEATRMEVQITPAPPLRCRAKCRMAVAAQAHLEPVRRNGWGQGMVLPHHCQSILRAQRVGYRHYARPRRLSANSTELCARVRNVSSFSDHFGHRDTPVCPWP